jgi:ubiquitin-conjugating enzyme E2 Q
MSLPADYPFSPPTVRVIRPRFKKHTGFVIGGALCMELLTPQGWNATFSIEALLEQVRAHMVQGKAALEMPTEFQPPVAETAETAADETAGHAAVDEGSAASGRARAVPLARMDAEARRRAGAAAERTLQASYSSGESERAFRHIVEFHQKKGWVAKDQLDS